MRGEVAEYHAGPALRSEPDVLRADPTDQDGPPDYWVTMTKGKPIGVEVKNASPKIIKKYGIPRIEVWKTRTSKGDEYSRYYKTDAFDVVAACMYGPYKRWEFRYKKVALLPTLPGRPDLLDKYQYIDDTWPDTLTEALSQ